MRVSPCQRTCLVRKSRRQRGKYMLDSLRYLRTFPRWEDRCFCTSSAYIWSASLSYISTWQPWTFVDTWRHAASLAACKGRLECRRHPSMLLWTRETIIVNAANQPLGCQACGSRARSRLSTCCYCWLIGLGHINDTYCDTLCVGLSWLETAIRVQKTTSSARRRNLMALVSREYNIPGAVSWKWNNRLGGIPWASIDCRSSQV